MLNGLFMLLCKICMLSIHILESVATLQQHPYLKHCSPPQSHLFVILNLSHEHNVLFLISWSCNINKWKHLYPYCPFIAGLTVTAFWSRPLRLMYHSAQLRFFHPSFVKHDGMAAFVNQSPVHYLFIYYCSNGFEHHLVVQL